MVSLTGTLQVLFPYCNGGITSQISPIDMIRNKNGKVQHEVRIIAKISDFIYP